jgi:hypothetical protein
MYLYPLGTQQRSIQDSYNLTRIYYSMQIKYYKALGLALSSDSASIEKAYKDTKYWVVS